MYDILPADYERGEVFGDLQEAAAFFAVTKPEADGRSIVVVNCLDYYRRASVLKKDADVILLQMLALLKDSPSGPEIRILMPESKGTDQELLIDLMSRGLYDFWFLASLSRAILCEVLETTRSFRELEAYLGTLPVSDELEKGHTKSSSVAGWLAMVPAVEDTVSRWVGQVVRRAQKPEDACTAQSLYTDTGQEQEQELEQEQAVRLLHEKPESMVQVAATKCFEPEDLASVDYALDSPVAGVEVPVADLVRGKAAGFFGTLVKRDTKRRVSTVLPPRTTVLFYSKDDRVMPYALGVMTAIQMAQSGEKTLLIELPQSGSLLGEALGLRHPDKNLAAALADRISGGIGAWDRFCFCAKDYHADRRAADNVRHPGRLPENLYFLPDDHSPEESLLHWEGFMASLIHWAVIEARYSYIVYIGFGDVHDAPWVKGLVCSNRIIAYQPWPGGFNEASMARSEWGKDTTSVFDGSWGSAYINKEIRLLRPASGFVIPAAVKEDFIKMTAFESDYRSWRPDSVECISRLCMSLA